LPFSIFHPKPVFVSLLLLYFGWQSLAADYPWENSPGFRRVKLQPVGAGREGFTLLTAEESGIFFTNALSEGRTLASEILPSGSGVAAGDVDGDGLCDLYFCALKTGNHLYRNLGNWKFEDITQQAGVGARIWMPRARRSWILMETERWT